MTFDKIRESLNTKGFFTSCSEEVDSIVELAIEEGWLIPVRPEWFLPGKAPSDTYVSSHVTCKETLPISLHNLIISKDPIKERDMVHIELKASFNQYVSCLGVVTRAPFINLKDEHVVEVSINHTSLVCKVSDITSWWSLQHGV